MGVGRGAVRVKNGLKMSKNVGYSRTSLSLTRGFWEEINRAKKPRTVEVPRVREVSYLFPIFWCYVLTCINTSIQLPYLDVSRFFKLIYIILLLSDLI